MDVKNRPLIFSCQSSLAWIVCCGLSGLLPADDAAKPSEMIVLNAKGGVYFQDSKGKVTEIVLLSIEDARKIKSDSKNKGAGQLSDRDVTVTRKLYRGTTLGTSSNGSATIVLPGAGNAILEPNTEIRLSPSTDKLSSLELLKGSLFMEISPEAIKSKGSAEFRLKTPTALLAVKGTQFFCLAKEDQQLVGVHEGAVEVSQTAINQTQAISAGNTSLMTAAGIQAPQPMPPVFKQLAKKYAEAKVIQSRMPFEWKEPTGPLSSGQAWSRTIDPATRHLILEVDPKAALTPSSSGNGVRADKNRIKARISDLTGTILAMKLTMRNINCDSITLSTNYYPKTGPVIWAHDSHDWFSARGQDQWSEWRDYVLTFNVTGPIELPTPEESSFEIDLWWTFYKSKASPEADKTYKIEIKDVSLLLVPLK